jgi:hypothetical protein
MSWIGLVSAVLVAWLVWRVIDGIRERRAWKKRMEEHKKAKKHTSTRVYYNK